MQIEVPKEPLRLRFNPEEASGMVQRVFSDDIARALWLMIKPGHLVDEKFDEWCLETALRIRGGFPSSLQSLHRIIHPDPPFLPTEPRFLSDDWEKSREWLERLWASINGSRPIQYEIVDP